MSPSHPSAEVRSSATGFGFPKAFRVRRRADYLRIQGRGRRIRTRHLLVLYLRSHRGPRFGLTVSRKVGNAVTRNRVKRRLREAIRLNRGLLEGRWDIVFIATPRAAGATFHQLEFDVKKGLIRIGESQRRSSR